MCIHLSIAGVLLAACSLLRVDAAEVDVFIAAFGADKGGDFEKAAQLYNQVLQTKPNCDECHWNMALGTSRLGRLAETQHHYREVVRILDDSSLRPGVLQKSLEPNHLGTALVSLGGMLDKTTQRDEAERLYTHAIELNPTNQQARDALRQLQVAQAPRDTPLQPPKFPDAERVTLDQLQADPDLMSGRRAFVLVGATDSWNGRDAWRDLAYFAEANHMRDTTVDFYPHNLAHASRKPWLKPWRDIVVDGRLATPQQLQITEQSPESSPAYNDKPYAQWRVPREVWRILGNDMLPEGWSAGDPTDDIAFIRTDPRVPDVYGSSQPEKSWLHNCIGGGAASAGNAQLDNWWAQTRWRMLLVGQENSTMFLHQDDIATATWQWQAVGRKRWLICPPEAAGDLYATSHMSPIDAFNPDVANYPLFAKANCSDIVANPGDVLYYPSHWFHQTLNLDPITVGVAGRHVNVHNFREVHTYFKRHCSTKPKRRVPNAPPLEPPTCSRLDSCLVEWQKIWDGTALRSASSSSAAPSTRKRGLSVEDAVGRSKSQRQSEGHEDPAKSGTPSVSLRAHMDSIRLGRFASAFEARDYTSADAVGALAAADLVEIGEAIGMETGDILKLSRSLRKRVRRDEL